MLSPTLDALQSTLRRPRFTSSRLLGMTATLAIAFAAFGMVPTSVDGVLLGYTLFGSSVGVLFRGPLGFIYGAVLVWLITAALIFFALFINFLYLLVSGQGTMSLQNNQVIYFLYQVISGQEITPMPS
ncbi:MAG: hypothetical protein AAGG48_01270 [Planctomycetota bacterium]